MAVAPPTALPATVPASRALRVEICPHSDEPAKGGECTVKWPVGCWRGEAQLVLIIGLWLERLDLTLPTHHEAVRPAFEAEREDAS